MDNHLQPLVVSPSQVPQLQPLGFYGADPEHPHHLRDRLSVLKKRKWWVIGAFLSVVVTAAVITFLMTPIYRGQTTLQIIQDNPSAIMGERDPLSVLASQDSVNLSRFYETQYMILSSRPMAYRIIDALNLKDHPEYRALMERIPEKSPEEIRSIFADQLLGNLSIKPVKKSFLVEVSYRSPDKYLSQQVPEAIYKEYVRFSMQTRKQSYSLIKDWLEGELQQLAQKVEVSERKLYEHGQQKDFLSLEGGDNVITRKYLELEMLLTKVQSEKTLKEAQFKQIKERGVDAPPITNNLLVQKLREETIAQEAKVASINRIYDANYPLLQAEQAKLLDLRSRMNNEVQRTRASIESDYEATLRAETLLNESMEAQKAKVVDLQHNLVQHHTLKRDMQTNEQLYQGLLARMKETSVTSTMVASNVAVIAPSELPLKPHSPKVMLNLLLASIIGLFGGVGLAFLVEYLDDSIKTTEELERVCRLPVLGVIPFCSTNNRELEAPGESVLELATFKEPKSLIAESVYHIRTSIMLSLSGGPPGALVVTSPNPNEGKTTLSVNLASSISTHGRKVVLVDVDLRKPCLHIILKEPLQPGLSNFLTGGVPLKDILRPTFIPNLYFIPAGTIPPNPVELLTSRAFGELIEKLRRDFQQIILDTPPVIGFADARAISPLVDGVLLVFRHNSTSREAGRLAMQLLTQVHAQVLGGVLNMAESDKLGYGGYYGYYKYYTQYYKQYQEPKRIESPS